MAQQYRTPPPPTPSLLLAHPAPHVLLVTINRPAALNAIPMAAHWEAQALFQWLDAEPSLRVAVVTGAGARAFCAGQDLAEQNAWRQAAEGDRPPRQMMQMPPAGFLGLSRRAGKKPVVAAVNGLALGGGMEVCLNCDMIVASPKAVFGLPEAEVGVFAAAGGLPRLTRLCGLPLASEIAIAGRKLSAEEALRCLLINRIAKTHESVVEEAVELAKKVAALNPDAVIVSRHGLREALETGSVARAEARTWERYGQAFGSSPNVKIGLEAFAKRKMPKWVDSKL